MNVIYGIGKVKPALRNTVAAIGIFDGVHKGHQKLIRKMVASARRRKARSLLITFHPHPGKVLHDRESPYLVSLSHRMKLVEGLGVDTAVVIKFTKDFARLKPEDFVRKYLVRRFGVREVFVGDDFRFGENRSGDVGLFERMGQQYGFKVNHMHPVENTARKISSTRLRELVSAGSLREAAALFGRNVSVSGKVIRGDGRGKKLGYPTANIRLNCGVLPPCGVYVVSVNIQGRPYRAVANIGFRPSFDDHPRGLTIEVHILGFKDNIYGCELTVEFLHKIREEQKFPSSEALVNQIRLDEQAARRYFRTYRS